MVDFTGRVKKISIGSDHAGYELKSHLIDFLTGLSFEVNDFGTHSLDPVGYPDICASVARDVREGNSEMGIVVGGSGQGEQIAANKVHGIRAALCLNEFTARLARLHNDANVISFGARIVAPFYAIEILKVFLATEFEGGRHVERIDQLLAIEKAECGN